MNYKVAFYVLTIVISMVIGYFLHGFKPVKEIIVTKVVPVVTTVTSNVYYPVYRTQYVTNTVTIDGRIVDHIIISENNAVTLAMQFQDDLLKFENKPLQITMSSYEIVNGIPPSSITMDAKLHYRTWSLLVSNNYTVKVKKVEEERKIDPFSINANYNLKSNKINLGIHREVLRIPLLGIPLSLGLETELN